MKPPRKKSIDSDMNLLELAHHLRQEHLFILSEKQQIQRLNSKILSSTERLCHLSWIIRQQKANLESLLSRGEVDPAMCCFLASAYENVTFVESYKKLGPNDSAYSALLGHLRKHPTLLAQCLNLVQASHDMHTLSQVVTTSLYGECLVMEDKFFMLTLLKELIDCQVASNENPRRVLRHGTCAFSRIYKMFSEGMSSAKMFLISVLHDPVISVLAEDDLYLDTDVQRAVFRFPADERLRHFGPEGSEGYAEKVEKYRLLAVEQLSSLVLKFVESIKNNFFCFPESLCWLVRQLALSLKAANKVDANEINAICADLVFGHFICHAIVHPEHYGIVDMHISAIAKFNLIQVAQVIQVLAMASWEEVDPKLSVLYEKFPKDCLSSQLNLFLKESHDSQLKSFNVHLKDSTRKSILVTENHLKSFVGFLYDVKDLLSDTLAKDSLEDILINVPKPAQQPVVVDVPVVENDRSKRNALSKSSKRGRSSREVNGSSGSLSKKSDSGSDFPPEVLVIPIENRSDNSLPGMASEEKILEVESQKRQTKVRMNLEANAINDDTDSFIGGSASEVAAEKRARFSQDQESVGTYDNLEVISEAPSNHSVASSVDIEEDENENDNLSDMVSANVSSGRGTPNVSGRDTPSSESSHSDGGRPPGGQGVSNGQAAVAVVRPTQQDVQLRSIPVTKPDRSGNQNDLEEKFGKFGFKPTESNAPDETKSMLSDTWSTDVLASDSEAFEHHDNSLPSLPNFNNLVIPAHQALLGAEFSETASQSDAWSTDALNSDTERLQEFDIDDNGSVRSAPARDEDVEPDPFGAIGAVGGLSMSALTGNEMPSPFADDFPKDGTIRPATRNSKHGPDMPSIPVSDVNASLIDLDDAPKIELPVGFGNNMQTLGRLSFEMRNRNLSEEEAVSFFMPFLRETESSPTPKTHRSSISELLSVDISKTTSAPAGQRSNGTECLIDFEDEFAAFVDIRAEMENNASPGLKVDYQGLSASSSTNDFRFSFTSISSNTTENGDKDGDSESPPAEKPVETRSVLEATGAIPKSLGRTKASSSREKRPPTTTEHSSSRGNGSRRSFFRGLNLKSKVQEKLKSLKEKRSATSTNNLSDEQASTVTVINTQMESVDDILEKYRDKQKCFESDSVAPNQHSVLETFDDIRNDLAAALTVTDKVAIFNNTKRKLRRVLSLVDIQSVPFHMSEQSSPNGFFVKADIELMKFLKVLLAEAKHLHNATQVVVLQETLRCVSTLDDRQCQQLFWSLREDFQRRSPYITYLIESKQSLLTVLAHFESTLEHLSQDKIVCTHNLMAICVKQYLERKEKVLTYFVSKFQKLTLADEKVELFEKFLKFLFKSMETDPVWQLASDEQLDYARGVMERFVISQIYLFALYPNGDGDVLRDQLLHQHMQNLGKVITPNHKDLRIPARYNSECPWTAAQEELLTINAYKSAREKAMCITRTCTVIMNLLSLATDRSVPAADDLMPVLVFVLIKANPPTLLSTVQYVNSFYEKQFEGEEAYWWIQFCSAVEFIKTMN
ncbi:GTPase-activating protein and VPS9 domain-containing protein 1 [Halotydeus destructor]|nr:GTPase-activating protein and VPS9 domain-containing protein 1 [Halotydeus destructor]